VFVRLRSCASSGHEQVYPHLVAESRTQADGTGVQVEPRFTGKTATLKITIECEKS
jgi:hypothetical protein